MLYCHLQKIVCVFLLPGLALERKTELTYRLTYNVHTVNVCYYYIQKQRDECNVMSISSTYKR